jgi:hypothetical protein
MIAILTIFFLTITCLVAKDWVPGEIIISFYGDVSESDILHFISDFDSVNLSRKTIISHTFNIHTFTFDEKNINENELWALVKEDYRVERAFFNYIGGTRNYIPDDRLFEYQWYLRNTGQDFPNATGNLIRGTPDVDIKATQAWHLLNSLTQKMVLIK